MSVLREHGINADQSTVSRWESGITPFPAAVVDAYEDILGVGAGVLHALGDILCGVERSSFQPPVSSPPPAPQTTCLDGLIDAIIGGTPTAVTWQRFSLSLPATGAYLHPDLSAGITCRLISELARSVGNALSARFSVASRLLRHSTMVGPLLSQVERFVTQPHAQAVAGPIALLGGTSDPRALHSLELFSKSDHEQTLINTATAASVAIHRDPSLGASPHFADLIARLITDVPLAEQDFAATSLAVALERRDFASVVSRVSRRHRDHLMAARATGEIVRPQTALRVSRTLALDIRTMTGDLDRHEPDLMVERLIREALFSASRRRRQIALLCIANTPYRHVAEEVVRHLLEDQRPAVALRAATAMPYFNGDSDAHWIIDHLDDSPTDAIDIQLLAALARWNHRLDARSLDRIADLTRGRGARIRFHGQWVLGMHEAAALHQQVHSCDADASGGAEWWIRQGAAVRH